MKHAVMITLAVLMLGACAERSERVYFEGNYYPPTTRAEKDDRRNFTASVRPYDFLRLSTRITPRPP